MKEILKNYRDNRQSFRALGGSFIYEDKTIVVSFRGCKIGWVTYYINIDQFDTYEFQKRINDIVQTVLMLNMNFDFIKTTW